MTYEDFCSLAKRARASRTEQDALALVEAYATTGDAVYPADYIVFLEAFGTEAPRGYRFQAYRAMGAATCIVKRA